MKFSLHIVLSLLCLSCFGEKLQLGEAFLEVEIAATEKELNKGLMFRESLPEGSGMLFIFQGSAIRPFWMKNTLIPLSIAFFDEDKTLLNIEDMFPINEEALPHNAKSITAAKYALEVPLGWFAKQKITPGMKFSFLDQEKSVK